MESRALPVCFAPQQVLVDGPQMGVTRQAVNFKNLALTEFVIKVAPSARSGPLSRAIDKSGVLAKWEETAWCKKLKSRAKRASLTDFERFKVKVNKQKVISVFPLARFAGPFHVAYL